MAQKVGYKQHCVNALEIIKKIRSLAKEFSRFELSKPVHEEMKQILRLCRRHWRVKPPYKLSCIAFIEDISQINDSLREIMLLTSGVLDEAQHLPAEYRAEFYEQLGITEIPCEFLGLGDNLQALLDTMLWSTEEFLEDVDTHSNIEIDI